MRTVWRLPALASATISLTLAGMSADRALALGDQDRAALVHYAEVLAAAHDLYGTDVSYRDLVHSSIHGMLRTLDPHSSFLPAEVYANMRARQRESFYGLGILVGMRNGQLTVIAPVEGTPASRMGLRAGDVIRAIEGDSTESMSLDEAVGRLKGPKGTPVTIQIVRPGLDRPLEVTIIRDEIPQNTVRYAYMVDQDTGYLAISDFNRGTGQEVAEAIEELEASGMEQLLLDLRNNGGGLLDQAIEVADRFLPSGAEIVETRGRIAESRQQYADNDRHPQLGLPLVVLVNAGTASAAEILAGAIQDNDVGLIVGTSTWGKGLVQTVYSLSYGSGIALTTSRYHTPSGRVIQRDYSSWFDYTIHPGSSDQAQAEAREIFYTDAGREVFGGRGITPDLMVEVAPPAPFIQYLLSRNAFFDFAVGYTARNPIPSPAWEPGQKLFGEYSDWLLDRQWAGEGELRASLEDPGTRETVLRYLHAEILNSAHGLEERHRILALGDEQIQRALELFGEASELLGLHRLVN